MKLLLGLVLAISGSLTSPTQAADPSAIAQLSPLLQENPSPSGVEVSQAGKVRAELHYQRDPDKDSLFIFKEVLLKLYRDDQLYLEGKPTVIQGSNGSYVAAPVDLKVQDLDGDKEPEVRLDYYTGGAHCCTYSVIYRYNPQRGNYYYIRYPWGNSGYRLQDLNQDGILEFRSQDDSFSYAFASYAASGRPIQIWQYRQGKMINVTRRYPKFIYADAYRFWKLYQQGKSKGYETKGMLAAYLADKYLLDQERDGWQRVKHVYQEGDRQQYFTTLRQFLQKNGYASGPN